MLSKDKNLEWAKKACSYVQKRITGNWLSNKICTWNMRSMLGPTGGKDKNFCDVVRTWAGRASLFGCGNCAEQSAIAFVYLEDSRLVPIDYMGFVKSADHAFVVIGRSENSRLEDISTWGAHSVICDPYENEYYPVLPPSNDRTFHKKIAKEKVRLLCRRKDNRSPAIPGSARS